MSFIAKLQRGREILEQQRRLSIRALGRELELGGDELDELVEELVDVQGVARREGAVLQWLPMQSENQGAGGRPAVASLGDVPDLGGARKVVTVVFADLEGSTALHERIDPESARRVMEAYYVTLRAAVERHEGTVVKLLGDGVMAAFGVPHVAEDDAIRGVRAGVAMQEAFRALVAERGPALGDVGLRVAINTGEVVVSGANDDVVGDPVNVAARLQQEARDGDVVLGEATRRLVDALVTLEPLGSFALRGRAEAVKAHRVVSLEPPARATKAAFVGRAEELGRIDAVYDEAVRTPATRLAVLLGSPGLGKSRLIGEFSRRMEEAATVVSARCDAAGGATFAPLADALRELLGVEGGANAESVRTAIEAVLPSDGDAARIATGIAALLAGSPAAPEETFFVVRRMLAGLAAGKPVVLVIDDLQWAEPLLLDLVEHLVQWGAGVPLLVLIGARPELRDVRSSLGAAGGLVRDVVPLAGLDAGAATRLAANVIGAADLPSAVAAKVLAASEGNPLFIGELIRMLVEEGALTREGDRWTIGTALATLEMPPTIHALLAARIERLRPEDRTVLERAAVVGRHFSRSAVAALLPATGIDLDARLEALRRSELIERDTGWLLGDPVLRFHHVLIRDAAYRRLLKETRVELHERLADWMEGRVGDAAEHDETIGRHLEEAHRLLGELGSLGEAGQRLGERAATRLAAAGRRALEADDVPLAADLLGRALDRLDANDPARADLALDWCEALLSGGDVGPAAAAIDELGRVARDSDRLRAWHSCFVSQHTVLTAPEELSATVDVVAAAAVSLASLGDAAGEAKAHFVHALALSRLGRVGPCEASLDKALAAARRAGDRRRANTVLAIAPLAALWGPSPVTRASGRCLDVVRVLRITQGAPAVEAVALSCQGVLEALRGRTDAAHRMIASAREMVEEFGIAQRLFEVDVFAGFVAVLEGDGVGAERTLRGAYEGLRDLGLGIDAARAAALLARVLLAQDRVADAESLSHESESLAGDDLKAAIAWRGVRAEALARRGDHGSAIELAKAGVEIAAATDALLDHADARLALAAALRAAGRGAEADAEEGRAIGLWESKGATLLAERARCTLGPPNAAVARSDDASAVDVVRRRVRPNAAVELMLGIEAGFAARDQSAIEALLSDPLHTVEHPTGATYAREGQVESIARMLRLPNLDFRLEVLATLGETLCLGRRRVTASGTAGGRFDVAEYEMDHLVLSEADEGGRLRRSEVFATDHLGDAIHRLYERHAELLPEGAAREQAATVARAWMALSPSDADPWDEGLVDPAVEVTDHRNLGSWDAIGAQALKRHMSALHDVARDATVRIEDVLALEPNAFLVRRLHSGIERVGGGVYERQYNTLGVLGPDGRLKRIEFFDIGDDVQALARFAARAGGTEPGRPIRRRVRENAATAAGTRISAAFAARDTAALEAVLGESLEAFDHRWHAAYGRDGVVETWRRMIKPEGAEHISEPITTLGERLMIERNVHAARGAAAGRFDVGAHATEYLALTEVDGTGQIQRYEFFAADRLTDALVRLYECYAESLPEGPARERASATARSFAIWSGPIDPDRLATAVTPSVGCIDHRNFGTWSAHGAEAFLPHWREQLELTVGWAMRDEAVLALDADRVLVRRSYFGSNRASGGTFENLVLTLWSFGTDGLLSAVEVWEPDGGEADALARFDAIVADAGVDPFDNAASSADREFVRCFNRRDWAGIEALAAPELVFDERRRMLHNTCGRDVWLQQLRVMFDVPASRFTTRLRATRGARLALNLHCFAGVVAGGGGPLAMDDHLVLHEVDDAGRITAIVLFDLDDVVAAYAELDARFEAGEASFFPNVARALSTTRLIGARNWQAWTAAQAPGFVYRDHRRLGFGNTVNDVDTLLRLLQATLELVPDARYRDDHLRVCARGILRQTALTGTRDGGAFENPMFLVFEVDEQGRNARADSYDLEDRDRALARFAELAGSTPPQRFANAATRAVDRGTAALAARDWEAFATLMAPGFRHYDRTRIAQLETDGREWLASIRRIVEMTTERPATRLLATRGERLALFSMLWRGAAGDVGPSEIHWRLIVEVNELGEHEAIVVYDPDDIDAAYAELDARFEAEQGDRLPESWKLLRRWTRAVAYRDWETVASFCTDDFVEHDHRSLSLLGVTQGAQAWLQVIRTVSDLAPDSVFRIRHFVPGVRGYYQEGGFYGTHEGGSFEIVINSLVEIGDQGLLRRVDLYDDDRVFTSPRWAELGIPVPSTARESDEPDVSSPTVAKPNAAVTSQERIIAAYAAQDLDAVRALCAVDLRWEDRRPVVGLSGDLELMLASGGERLASSARPQAWSTIGTAGDRVAVSRVLWAGGPVDGRFEVEFLVVNEVDEAGLCTASIFFDTDDTREAQRLAWARWAAIDPDAAAVAAPLGDVVDAFNEKSAMKWRAAFADDLVVEDHRLAGMGRIEGADAYTKSVVALWKLAPVTYGEMGWWWPAFDRHGAITVVHRTGTVPDGGGDFESEYLYLYLVGQGRITRIEIFEMDALDVALTRFEELRPRSSDTIQAP